MTGRRATRIVIVALSVAALALAALIVFFVQARRAGFSSSIFSYSDLAQQLPGLAFLIVGAVLAIRRPENRVGWICLANGMFQVLGWAAVQYAAHGLVVDPGSLPGSLAFAVATEAAFAPAFVLIVLLLVTFPDGRLPSRRWRVVPIAVFVGFLGLYAVGTTSSFPAPFAGIANPLHYASPPRLVMPLAIGISLVLAIAGVVGAFACVVVRFRRGGPTERAQLKWLMTSATILPLGLIAHSLADSFAPAATGVIEFVFSIGIVMIPVAIGVAVLKYHLYDIDRVISRTISFALLTLTLGGAYAGLVLAGQAVFSSFAGGSNLAVAASTLVVAALFLPLRSRVQRIVDRRFNRHRYDAQRTLEAFGSWLREQVDLDELTAELRTVVADTMQPAHITFWHRGEAGT